MERIGVTQKNDLAKKRERIFCNLDSNWICDDSRLVAVFQDSNPGRALSSKFFCLVEVELWKISTLYLRIRKSRIYRSFSWI